MARSYGVSCRQVPVGCRLLQNSSASCSISAAPGERVDIHVPRVTKTCQQATELDASGVCCNNPA